MTIAWLLERYPSPTETFIARDIAALRERGFDVQVWALRAGEGAQEVPRLDQKGSLSATIRDSITGAWRERTNFWKATGQHWARVCRPELEHVQWLHAGWANYPAWLACGAAQELGVPWSFSAHARDLWVDGGDLGAKLRSARLALCCTQEGVARLRVCDPSSADKVIYAPHGLRVADFSFIAWQPPSNEQVRHILSVGRLVPKKGFDLLIEAVAQLQRGGLPIAAHIVGEGPERASLEAQIARLGLSSLVHLEGALPAHRVAQLMAQTAGQGGIFALPCRVMPDGDRDGLPNVLLEAAVCGLPLVVAQAGSVTDLVDATTGILCPPNDARALSQALRAVWDAPDATRALCFAARQKVIGEHDSAHTGQTLAEAFLKESR